MRTYLVAGVIAVLGVSAIHAATTIVNPDVTEASVYRCVRGDNSIEFTNVEPSSGKTCVKTFTYGLPAPGRPGLSTYRVLFYDSEPVGLYSTERLDIVGNRRSAWVMLSYAAPLRRGEHGQPYTRTVAKFTVDCVRSTIEATSGHNYAVEGGRVVIVGPEPAWPVSEPLPETVADSVLKHLCELKIEQSNSKPAPAPASPVYPSRRR